MVRKYSMEKGKNKTVLIFLSFMSLSGTVLGTLLVRRFFPTLKQIGINPLYLMLCGLAALFLVFVSGNIRCGLFLIPFFVFSYFAMSSSLLMNYCSDISVFSVRDLFHPLFLISFVGFAFLILSFKGFKISGRFSAGAGKSRYVLAQRRIYFAQYVLLSLSIFLLYFCIYHLM